MTIQIDIQSAEHVQLAKLTEGVQELNRLWIDSTGSPAIFVSKSDVLCSAADDGTLVDHTVDSLAALLRVVCIPGKYRTDKEAEEAGTKVFIEEPKLPRDLMKAYVDTHHWIGVPRVKQVTRAPIVRPDFTIRWDAGWDELTQCWVVTGLKKDTSLLDRPGGIDMREVFKVFPFVDKRLVADAIAAALTPLLSTAMSSPLPSLIVSARKVGSGKTELAKTCSILGNGGKTFTTWRGNNELEKMIQTYVAEDKRVVIFDNIKNDIDSTIMESVITSRKISYRKIYTQRSTDITSNTSWFMTANGAIVSEDMVRRSIVIMLDKDATGSASWDETFPVFIELCEEALVTAMCAMIENWRDAGCVPGTVMFSNFPEWSRTVSGILDAAGIEGMWEARELVVREAIQTDDEDEIPVVEAIAWIMGDEEWHATELWERANDFTGVLDPKTLYVKEWLNAAVKNGAQTKRPAIPTGRALHKIVGKQFEGSDVVLEMRMLDGRKVYQCRSITGAPLKIKPMAEGGPSMVF